LLQGGCLHGLEINLKHWQNIILMIVFIWMLVYLMEHKEKPN